MKKILIAIAVLLSFNAFADTYVRGYTKQNGTYLEPHYRSSPNETTRKEMLNLLQAKL